MGRNTTGEKNEKHGVRASGKDATAPRVSKAGKAVHGGDDVPGGGGGKRGGGGGQTRSRGHVRQNPKR